MLIYVEPQVALIPDPGYVLDAYPKSLCEGVPVFWPRVSDYRNLRVVKLRIPVPDSVCEPSLGFGILSILLMGSEPKVSGINTLWVVA